MGETGPVVEIRGVSKDYRGLRPLRIEQLEIGAGESVALLGFDQVMAEVLVDLITGRSVPDRGEVIVFGRHTTALHDGDAWLRTLDRFGLLSDRAVLIDQLTAEVTLAMAFSFGVEVISAELRQQVHDLSTEVGLPHGELPERVGTLASLSRLRLRLARTLAMNPPLLVAEHPSASLSREESTAFADDFRRILAARRLATLVLTADRPFAEAVAGRVLTLQPGTGELRGAAAWRRWFT